MNGRSGLIVVTGMEIPGFAMNRGTIIRYRQDQNTVDWAVLIPEEELYLTCGPCSYCDGTVDHSYIQMYNKPLLFVEDSKESGREGKTEGSWSDLIASFILPFYSLPGT